MSLTSDRRVLKRGIARRIGTAILGLAMGVALAACSTLFSQAMDAGDAAAKLGNWDEAAKHYQEAAQLEPSDKEAQMKLTSAHQHQAADRVKVAKGLLAEGRPRDALRPAFDATQFDPNSADAKTTFEAARKGTLDEARKEFAAQNYRQSLLVSREVLALLPQDTEAADIEGQSRTKIAEIAIGRAQGYEKDKKPALALLLYSEAAFMRPDNGTASAGLASYKHEMQERAMFNVVLGTFDGDTAADNLGSNIGASDIARGIDPSYLMRVSDHMPKEAPFKMSGMRLGGLFKGYKFAKNKSKSQRHCDYICGTEMVINPDYAPAQNEVNAAQLELANAQNLEQSAQQRIPSLQRALDGAQQNENGARQAADSASSALSQCQSANATNPQACSSLQAVKDQADSRYQEAQANRQRAEADLSEGQNQLSDASSRRSSAESNLSSAQARFASTPPQIQVDKHCNHDYGVETVSERGDVTLHLSGESLYDETSTLNETVNGHYEATDETFKAEPGFCQEVAAGDPLVLPGEGDVKKHVVEDAVSHAQGSIVASYEKYRTDYLVKAKNAERDQQKDDATDAYVRFLFTATHPGEPENDARTRAAALAEVDPDAIDLAVKR